MSLHDGQSRMRRLRMGLLFVGLCAVCTATTGVTTPLAASSGEWVRDRSGLMVHSGEYRDLGQVPPEADVELAASEYVAQVAPEDFGGAWFDRENGHVVLAAATPRGASIITSLREGATSISAALSKSTAESREMDAKADKGLPALTAGLKSGRIEQRLVTYDSQFLMRVQDRLTQFSSTDGIGEPVWMTRVDVANNRVIVTVDQFTQDLAQEIVTTFGPDVVAVEVASDPVPVVPAAGR